MDEREKLIESSLKVKSIFSQQQYITLIIDVKATLEALLPDYEIKQIQGEWTATKNKNVPRLSRPTLGVIEND